MGKTETVLYREKPRKKKEAIQPLSTFNSHDVGPEQLEAAGPKRQPVRAATS
jgi:hypothetical protein